MIKKLIFSFAFFVSSVLPSFCQQVMMQGWYWDYPKTADGFSWADTLADKAASLADAGFTHIWFPPHAVASSGPRSNGYDPQDLFIGNQTTGLGTRAALDNMLQVFATENIDPVGDLIYNHRDGGAFEENPAVKDYITIHMSAGKSPYPSDRFRCVLPLGGDSGNGVGDYYFKISSKTQNFTSNEYKFYATTSTLENDPFLGAVNESEPNGGGDCGQPFDDVIFNQDMVATLFDWDGCFTDEFKLTITAGDFDPDGDELFIYLNNSSGGYSDHRIYGIYSAPRDQDIASELIYETYTDHTGHASGRGGMNFESFKPNTATTSTTGMNGDWDSPIFFYDYDQFHGPTRDTLFEWTAWNWETLGVRGLRMDAVKHFPPSFVGDVLDDMYDRGYVPTMAVGELFSNNSSELSAWLDQVLASMDSDTKAAIPPKIFDFTLRENLRLACDDGFFDARNLFTGSLRDVSAYDGFHIVTFVNNHDFREPSGFNALAQNDPILAYAYILTNNQLGVPTIFYPDYFGGESIGSLKREHDNTQKSNNTTAYKTEIDELINILQDEIQNASSVTYLNAIGSAFNTDIVSGFPSDVVVYQLTGGIGGSDIVVAINFGSDPIILDQNLNTTIMPGDLMQELTSNANTPDVTVSASGAMRIDLPPRSYAVFKQSMVLPVRWLSLQAETSSNEDHLTWIVVQDGHQKQYTVERLAQEQWVSVTEKRAESGSGVKHYEMKIPSQRRVSQYRISAEDLNGDKTYSDVVVLRRNLKDITIGPNPTKDIITINGLKGKNDIKLINPRGKILLNTVTEQSNYILQLPASIPAGYYILKINDYPHRIIVE